MKLLQLFVAIFLGGAGAASADCSRLNSVEFLAATPWEQVVVCVEQVPNAMTRTDGRGNTLLMTALGSNIQPMQLDELLSMVPEDLRDQVFEAKDGKGRTLGHIAASVAPDPAFLFVLSSSGVSLLEEFDDARSPLKAGQTPLHFAAEREDGGSFVAALMALHTSDLEDDKGRTAFDIASSQDRVGEAALLLADGRWPDIVEAHFKPPQPAADAKCETLLTSAFFAAATAADIVACLKGGNQLFAVDRDGNSILHLAALRARDPWVVDLMLAAAEDPSALLEKRNSAGKTPLHLAAEAGAAEVLLHILAWGANPDALFNPANKWIGKDRGFSALHMAASRKDDRRADAVRMLLAYGANTMLQDTGTGKGPAAGAGRTALHRAILDPDPVVMLMLLEAQLWQENLVASVIRSFSGKAVKQISDDAGRTALHIAASRPSDFDTLWLLLAYGFSVDEKDDQNNTPLMFAAQNFMDADNFLFLLESSKNPCGSSKDGVKVEAALRSNEALMSIGAEDTSGKTLSPLALLKQRCP